MQPLRFGGTAVWSGIMLAAAVAMAGPADPGAAAPAEMQREPIGVIDDTGGMPQVKQQNGISYISGGAGSDEADALNAVSSQFNLKVTMAVLSGQFTSPSSLVIEDAAGKTVLQLESAGPILLAKLPSGQYVINATAEGRKQTRKVNVPASGLEAIAMTWLPADEPNRAGDAPELRPMQRPDVNLPHTMP